MKTLTQIASSLFGILVFVGVVKGLNASDLGGADLGQILGAIVDGVADLTIYLVPNIWQVLSG